MTAEDRPVNTKQTRRLALIRIYGIPYYLSVLLLLAISAMAPACATAQEKNVVIHIGQYSNDLHSAAMGLSLAGMLQKEGAEVTIFLDREAVRMAEQGQPLLTYGDSDTEALMTSFVSNGGRVLLCPHCAELGGVEASELREGTEMGTPETIAALFMAADIVIDY